MARSDKIISGILLGHGLLGGVWVAQVASGNGYPLPFLVSNMALALTGVTAGIGCFLGKRWAAYTGLVFWWIQVFHFVTPTFQFSFTLGFNAVFSAGWYGFGEIGVNVFPIAMLWWLAARMSAPGSSFRRAADIVTG